MERRSILMKKYVPMYVAIIDLSANDVIATSAPTVYEGSTPDGDSHKFGDIFG